jgi:hypothetical protein
MRTSSKRARAAVLTLAAIAVACSRAPTTVPAAGRAVELPTGERSSAPRLSARGDRLVLSWTEPGGTEGPVLKFSVRSHGAWSAPGTAPADPHRALDTADVPGVVPLAGGGLAAHWTRKLDASLYARDLVVAVSSDGGATWGAPALPHHDGTASEHGMATIVASEADGRFGIVWLDGRAGELSENGAGGTALYWADWNGTAFGPETLLDPRVCDCCKTSAASGPSGPIVAYRDRADDERRDIGIVRESEGRWSAPRLVHDDGWKLTACPTNGPAIGALGERAAVAWFTGASASPSVWAALSADAGGTLSAPARLDGGHPVGRVETAVLRDGSAAVVWLERAGDRAEVRARRLAPDGSAAPPVTLAITGASKAAGYPRIVGEGERDVLVVWTDTTGASPRVRGAEVTLP